MAYVPVPFPQTLYDRTGLAVTVPNRDAAATLPATFAALPVAESANTTRIAAATAGVNASAEAVMTTNVPTVNKRKGRGEN